MAVRPSLLELCVQSAIDNIQYLRDVGDTDIGLLKIILSHCTPEQLQFIEESTEGRDLSPATDELWLKFYERQFGEESANIVKKRMKEKRVSFKWRLLYQAKAKEQEEKHKKCLERSVDRLKQYYAKAESEKEKKKIKVCTALPPGGGKRKFTYGGTQANFVNVKGPLMKKAKMEFAASREAIINATLYNKAMQSKHQQCVGSSSSLHSASRGVSSATRALSSPVPFASRSFTSSSRGMPVPSIPAKALLTGSEKSCISDSAAKGYFTCTSKEAMSIASRKECQRPNLVNANTSSKSASAVSTLRSEQLPIFNTLERSHSSKKFLESNAKNVGKADPAKGILKVDVSQGRNNTSRQQPSRT
eukprot:TRINITY_DN2108_c0_g2_i1.p1 TRINITY_DN2108_c0_g2~~TRINITY_DN2108_c0_g2_i1.p1  ORF type:complete len:361 (-),score=78.96 TRINITY_DN2108_c0_g2_i1:688-1770(-)